MSELVDANPSGFDIIFLIQKVGFNFFINVLLTFVVAILHYGWFIFRFLFQCQMEDLDAFGFLLMS